MKAVRGSDRAATKAPRKQNQEKSKKTTAKRPSEEQVKCPRDVAVSARFNGGVFRS